MPRKKTEATLKIEAISARSGFSEKHLRQLHSKQFMPLELDAALHWLENRPDAPDDSDGTSTTALRKEKIRLTRLQAEKIAHALEIQRGEHIHRTHVEAAFVEITAALQAALRLLESELPATMLGLPLSKSAPLAKARIRQVQKALSEGEASFWKDRPMSD